MNKQNIFKAVFLVLFTTLVAFSIAKGMNTPEQEYKDLQATLDKELIQAFDAQERMLEFMEKRKAETGEYNEAEKYKQMRLNRSNWKITF